MSRPRKETESWIGYWFARIFNRMALGSTALIGVYSLYLGDYLTGVVLLCFIPVYFKLANYFDSP